MIDTVVVTLLTAQLWAVSWDVRGDSAHLLVHSNIPMRASLRGQVLLHQQPQPGDVCLVVFPDKRRVCLR